MNNWFLFAGHHYYPSGGMNDFVRSFASKEDAENYIETLKSEGKWRFEWDEIVDVTSPKYHSEDYKMAW